jgi:hypothetical protein
LGVIGCTKWRATNVLSALEVEEEKLRKHKRKKKDE